MSRHIEFARVGETFEQGHRLAEAVPELVQALLPDHGGRIYQQALRHLERPLLEYVLGLTRGNQLRAARLLGLNRNTLRKRCRELNLLVRRPSADGRNGDGSRQRAQAPGM